MRRYSHGKELFQNIWHPFNFHECINTNHYVVRGARGSNDPLNSTFCLHCDYKKNRTFRQFKWSAWKLLGCRIAGLLQIPQDFWDRKVHDSRCESKNPPPQWKFLPTGLPYYREPFTSALALVVLVVRPSHKRMFRPEKDLCSVLTTLRKAKGFC